MKIAILSLFIFFCACTKPVAIGTKETSSVYTEGTSTGNPVLSLKVKAFSNSNLSSNNLSTLNVSSLKMCFKRIRFRSSAGEDIEFDSSEDSEIKFGDLEIINTGTELGKLKLPKGNYNRLEIDLNDDCSSKKSVQLINSNGSFATDDRISIRFEGNISVSADNTLELSMQKIIDSLNTVTNNEEIDEKAESINGSF